MRPTLIFLFFISVFIFSCNRPSKEEAFLNALERSNTFILDANEEVLTFTEIRLSSDPRPKTQEIRLKINKINSSTISYTKKLEKNKVEIKADELHQFKKDLIRNNINSPDWDYFLEDDFYLESEIDFIPYQVAINDLYLLENQMIMHYVRNVHWSDLKIDKQQAIFKIDSNTYLALFAIGPDKENIPQVTINSIIHNEQKLSPDQYSFQYKTGFYGIIMNLDGERNDNLGEYIIRYEINWNEKEKKGGFNYEYTNIFLIEE